MKCLFNFNGVNYISPTKKSAKSFLRHFGERADIRRFKTTWRLKTIERAPSYSQMMAVDLPHIEYGRKEASKWLNAETANELLKNVREGY
jgi:hypothetical protein